MSGAPRRSGACARCCFVLLAVASALCVSGPALYWKYKKGLAAANPCGPCVCHCPLPFSLHNIAPASDLFSGLIDLSVTVSKWSRVGAEIYVVPSYVKSVTDCGKHDPELNKEMEKEFVDLLTEELKLQEAVAEKYAHHRNATLVDAKRLAAQYQKEAEKCNAATETCEEAREQAEAALMKEKKITPLWERRAHQVGWQGE